MPATPRRGNWTRVGVSAAHPDVAVSAGLLGFAVLTPTYAAAHKTAEVNLARLGGAG